MYYLHHSSYKLVFSLQVFLLKDSWLCSRLKTLHWNIQYKSFSFASQTRFNLSFVIVNWVWTCVNSKYTSKRVVITAPNGKSFSVPGNTELKEKRPERVARGSYFSRPPELGSATRADRNRLRQSRQIKSRTHKNLNTKAF